MLGHTKRPRTEETAHKRVEIPADSDIPNPICALAVIQLMMRFFGG